MSEFTKGPWVIDGLDISPKSDAEISICAVQSVDVGGHKGWFHGGETKANSCLIASAPDLYAEHKEWSEKFGAALMAVMQEDFGPITDLAMSMPFDFHKDGAPTLRSAALSKAKGETK